MQMSNMDAVPLPVTARLRLRRFTVDDMTFVLQLFTDADVIRYIGDRGVHNLADARRYVELRLLSAYRRYGFGLYAVTRRADDALMGMCGLVQRKGLDDVDLGFAFLPLYRGQGYAREAATAVLAYAQNVLKLPRLAAITDPENGRSIHLLQILDFQFQKQIQLPNDPDYVNLYTIDLLDKGESNVKS